jgi:2-polyprenyl-3-methyl-5-hydroxy-6-metoxy-1,4-benzoquinol methylase
MSKLGVQYSSLTVNDRNRFKRYLQRRRLQHSLRGLAGMPVSAGTRILDAGAGDGELARLLRAAYPQAGIVCYEPADELRQQAIANVGQLPKVNIVPELHAFADHAFDIIFCLEVLEHLPPAETGALLRDMERLLAENGRLVIGVPNEIYLAALLRGAFRRCRRSNDFDTSLRNMLLAIIGHPPGNRPVEELMPGRYYHRRHMGFDYRGLAGLLSERFEISNRYGSPLPWLPVLFNFEVYFVCARKRLAGK